MNDATALSRPVSVRNTKAAARAAYLAGLADPAADWRAIAAILYAALPAEKLAKTAADGWADYPVDRYKNRGGYVVAVTFADGEKVRASFASPPDKPINIGRAMRIAAIFWRARIAARLGANTFGSAAPDWLAVPEVTACHVEQAGNVAATYDADLVNAKTADYRAGSFDRHGVMAKAAALGLPTEGEHRTADAFMRAHFRLAALANDWTPPPSLNPFSRDSSEDEAAWLRYFVSPSYDDSLRSYLCSIDIAGDRQADDTEQRPALAFRLDRARRLRDAVETLRPVADAAAAAEFRAGIGETVALEWHSHTARRGGREWKLMLGARQIGSTYAHADEYNAVADIVTPEGSKAVKTTGKTLTTARRALERELSADAAALFGRAAVAFTEVAAS